MRWITLITAGILVASPGRADTIMVDPAHPTAAQKSELGMNIKLTGPTNLPNVYGLTEVVGGTMPLLVDKKFAHEYSGAATFAHPITSISFDVARANDSGWENLFTIDAYHNGKRVAVKTANIDPVGDGTHVTISAPAIDTIDWHGQGWIFHPYTLRNMSITTDAIVGDPNSPGGVVGAPAPEPASAAIVATAVGALLLRRRRSQL